MKHKHVRQQLAIMAITSILCRVYLWLLLFMITTFVHATRVVQNFNVRDFGAVPDAKTDSSKAFEKTWKKACSRSEGRSRIVIKGSYMVGPLTFRGPCKGVMLVKIKGQLSASTHLNAYQRNWIEFQYINGLKIFGRGILDGRGALAWPHNTCHKNLNCKRLPMVFASKNMQFTSIKIAAPADSPNTDGIHIGESNKINITDSVIGTGDDCISIGPGSSDIYVSRVRCGPGHGISIGSLGKGADEGDVVGVTVKKCVLNGTDNGLRIKTWQSSPKATHASHMLFEDIVMDKVYNPIVIDQKYCPHGACSAESPSRVSIRDIKFRKIKGTSASPIAINLLCSDAVECKGIELSDINLEYRGTRPAAASCVNVQGKSNDNVKPLPCI